MTRIILDTDLAMGAGSDIDDGFALALALAEPAITVEMITTVSGNTDVESATVLTLEMLQRLGHPGVPVFKGAAAPLTRPDRVRVPAADTVKRFGHHEPTPGYAAAEIARYIMANPGEITLVAIGPLTNVAVALSLEPRLAQNVREIVIMGGVFFGQTLESRMPGEFNVWNDPEAAAAVINSGAKVRWVGLDVTTQVRLTTADAQRLLDGEGGFSVFAGEATLAWIKHQAGENPGDPRAAESCAMHDPLAVAVLTHPEFVTWTPAHVSVVTGEGNSRGVMVTDTLRSANAPAANCVIASAVDADRFREYFLTQLNAS